MLNIRQNILLASFTSWQVGGPAEYFFLPQNLDELKAAVAWAEEQKMPVSVLGGGSNVLVSDQGIKGLVLCLKKFTGTQVEEKNGFLCIQAHAGTAKSELLRIFLKYKLAPALFLAGLPGDVGGGVVMNAGVAEKFQPREFEEIVDFVAVLKANGTVVRFHKDSLNWSYRHSAGWEPGIIVEVGFRWRIQIQSDILNQVKIANKTRLSKQPLDLPSCGSVFVNPQGHKAAQLIDACGLKGFTFGGAQVSQKHANFIVNIGNAKASDFVEVIDHIQKIVLLEKQVSLRTEVIKLGF